MSKTYFGARAVFAHSDTAAIYGSRTAALQLADDDSLDIASGTIAFDFTTETLGRLQGLYSRDAAYYSGDGNHLSIYIQKGSLIARVQHDGGEVQLRYDGLSAETETHVAFTFDGETVKLFVDGAQADSAASGFTQATSPEQTQFGALGWMSTSGDGALRNPLQGEMSDMLVLDQALEATEVAALAIGETETADDGTTTPDTGSDTGSDTGTDTDTGPDTPETDTGDTGNTGDTDTGGAADEKLPSPIFAQVSKLLIYDPKDVLVLPDDDSLDIATGTIAFGFTAHQTRTLQGLYSRDAINHSGDGNHLSIYIQKGSLIARVQHDGGEVQLRYDGLSAETETHVAFTFDGETVKLFVDGAQADSAASGFTQATSPEQTQFGALGWMSTSGDDRFDNIFNGIISDAAIYDAAIYDVALGEDEIGRLAQGAPVIDETDSNSAPETPDTPETPTEDGGTDTGNTDTGNTDTGNTDTGNTDTGNTDTGNTDTGNTDTGNTDTGNTDTGNTDTGNTDTGNTDTGNTDTGTDTGAGGQTGGNTPLDPLDSEDDHGSVIGLGGPVSVMAGRVSTLSHEGDDIASVRILDLPDFGNVTVNPDNTMALVLSMTQQTGTISFSYEVTYDNGATEVVNKSLNVTPGSQEKGWGEGNHYTLEVGDDGNYVVEHGDIHRPVHVSESSDALSLRDIANLEGLGVDQITGTWLANNPEYGGTPDMALKPDAGMALWKSITGQGEPSSHWLLFERGYEYNGLGGVLDRDSVGESELHPLYVGAYGSGDDPVIRSNLKITGNESQNIVIQGLNLDNGAMSVAKDIENVIFDDVQFGGSAVLQQGTAFTIRDSSFIDIVRDAPSSGGDWRPHVDRIQGIYSDRTDGLLMEGLFLDHVAWADDYDPDLSSSGGQPPSMFSHNIYINYDNSDVTMRDSISMRASSYGAQIRPGGVVEDNIFIDNNAGFNVIGGNYLNQGFIGEYSMVSGNVVTSAAHKEAYQIGGLTMGFANMGADTTMIDNIIAHLADPNDPDDLLAKPVTHFALRHKFDNPYYDDTIVYNWQGANFVWPDEEYNDRNVDGLDQGQLDQTTIQLFTAALLGQSTATPEDLANYLRAIYQGDLDESLSADDIIAYFQTGFGIEGSTRVDPAIIRFVPDDRADGMRWDVKQNWQGGDRPMDGDTVQLGGNWVTFGGTVALSDLQMGDGGRLDVSQGKLTVEGALSGGENAQIDIDDAGQLWVETYGDDDQLDIDIDGGRFANTGFFDGLLDMHVTDGQALLGVDDAVMELGQQSAITVDGSQAKVGFDGAEGGVSVLRMETGSELRMIADGNGFSTIEEFRSGANDNDTPDVLSAFDMGEGTLLIDIGAIAGGAAREDVLVDTDQVVGMFDDIEFIGLGANQDATLTVDYETDKVTVALGQAGQGSGNITVATIGDMLNAAEDAEIWDALTEGQGIYEEIDPDPTVNGEELDEEDVIAA
jgi:uncharacterized beta-barrel protein YwiB (DUF1934 family)